MLKRRMLKNMFNLLLSEYNMFIHLVYVTHQSIEPTKSYIH